MKSFYLMKNIYKDEDYSLTNKIEDYIRKKGGVCQINDEPMEQWLDSLEIPNDCDCIIVLGGDGSILRAVRATLKNQIPIVGVNLGTMGFLTEIDPENIEETLDCLLEDRFEIEQRMMLKGIVYRDGEEVYRSVSLNDIAVCHSGFSRMIRLELYINGELLDVYDADGVVVATPTGSTAYNLSAGGPVVNPKMNLMIVTPVSPHSLSSRSVVLSEQDMIEIKLKQVRKTQREEAVATFDGQTGFVMKVDDVIRISNAEQSSAMIKIQNVSFYEILRQKMNR